MMMIFVLVVVCFGFHLSVRLLCILIRANCLFFVVASYDETRSLVSKVTHMLTATAMPTTTTSANSTAAMSSLVVRVMATSVVCAALRLGLFEIRLPQQQQQQRQHDDVDSDVDDDDEEEDDETADDDDAIVDDDDDVDANHVIQFADQDDDDVNDTRRQRRKRAHSNSRIRIVDENAADVDIDVDRDDDGDNDDDDAGVGAKVLEESGSTNADDAEDGEVPTFDTDTLRFLLMSLFALQEQCDWYDVWLL